MGTELGLSDVLKGCFNAWRAGGIGRGPESDVEPDEGGAPVEAVIDDEEHPFLFGFALPIAGCLHIVSNCVGDLLDVLTGWDGVFQSVQMICKLLCRRAWRDRFINNCLRGEGAPESVIKVFDRQKINDLAQ